MTSPDLLRIAIPKGRLLREVLDAFAVASFDVPNDADIASRKLVFERGAIEWIFVKDCDVPVYVEHGAADAGVCGYDQFLEHGSTAHALVELPFGACRMSVISKTIAPMTSVATKYPRIARDYLDRIAAHAEIVALGGSVELAAVLDLTTHVIDLVQSGNTIRANGLVEQEVITNISPWFIAGRDSYRTQTRRIRDVAMRIEESMHARL